MLEGGKGNYMSFCILKVIEAMSGEQTEVPDLVDGLIVRNFLTHDQNAAIEGSQAYPLPPIGSFKSFVALAMPSMRFGDIASAVIENVKYDINKIRIAAEFARGLNLPEKSLFHQDKMKKSRGCI